MSIDSRQAFMAMTCAYRYGVLAKLAVMQGEVLQMVMDETGLNLSELLNRVDEISEDTILNFDRYLGKSGSMLKMASSPLFMKIFSRMIDISFIKKSVIKRTKNSILKAIDAETGLPGGKAVYRQEGALTREG